MSEPDSAYDAVHPSGHLMFRSCRGGCLHSVLLSESAMDADSDSLARAVLLTAEVSHLAGVMQVRQEIIDAGFTPSADIPGPSDLSRAEGVLLRHRLLAE